MRDGISSVLIAVLALATASAVSVLHNDLSQYLKGLASGAFLILRASVLSSR